MKAKSVFILLIILIPLVSCKKKITQFYIDYNSSVVIQSSVGVLVPFNINTPEITTNSEVEFESNNTKKDKIKSILLQELSLTITSPSSQDFSFLNSVEIFISSPNNSEKKVGFRDNIGSNPGSKLVCDIVNLDLQEFVKDEKFTVRIKTVTDEVLSDDIHIDVYTNFLVDAKLIN